MICVFQTKMSRSSHQRCSAKKGVLRNFTKFTGKHLCQSLFFNKVDGAALSCSYCSINCDSENLIVFLESKIIEKSVSEKKISFLIGDFNMNCLKNNKNAKTKHFYGNIYQKSPITIINRPIRISEHSADLIDNILTTVIFNNSLKKGIIKSDVFDHSPLFLSIQPKNESSKSIIKIELILISVI